MRLFNIPLLIIMLASALFASFGLSMRVPASSVPTEIMTFNGTGLGFSLAAVVFVIGYFVDDAINQWLAMFIPIGDLLILQSLAVGVLIFASGATNLSFWNNN